MSAGAEGRSSAASDLALIGREQQVSAPVLFFFSLSPPAAAQRQNKSGRQVIKAVSVDGCNLLIPV